MRISSAVFLAVLMSASSSLTNEKAVNPFPPQLPESKIWEAARRAKTTPWEVDGRVRRLWETYVGKDVPMDVAT